MFFLSLPHGLLTGFNSLLHLHLFQHIVHVLIHVHLDVFEKIFKLLVTGEGLDLGVSQLIMLAKPGEFRHSQIV